MRRVAREPISAGGRPACPPRRERGRSAPAPPRLRALLISLLACLIAALLPDPAQAGLLDRIAADRERGLPCLAGFSPSQYEAWSANLDVLQDESGFVWVANSKGILQYDGVRWRLIRHPLGRSPLVLAVDGRGSIVAGFEEDLGYLLPTADGGLVVRSLRPLLPDSGRVLQDIVDIGYHGEEVLFIGRRALYRWRPAGEGDGSLERIPSPEGAAITASTALESQHILALAGGGLASYRQGEIILLPVQLPAATLVEAAVPFGPEQVLLLGTQRGRPSWHLLTGTRLRPFFGPVLPLAERAGVNDCIPLENGGFALFTERAGVVVFSRAGEVLQRIGEEEGLPGDVAFTGALDREGGLWVALNHGLARVRLLSPLSRFNDAAGLEGKVYSVARHQGVLYAGTDEGVYRLLPGGLGAAARFERVPGSGPWSRKIASVGPDLMVAARRGVLRLREGRLEPVLDLPGCLYLAPARRDSLLFVGTDEHGVRVLARSGADWKALGPLTGTDGNARELLVENDSLLWLSADSRRHIERVRLAATGEGGVRTLQVRRFGAGEGLPASDFYYPFLLEGEVVVGAHAGLYRLARGGEHFLPDDRLRIPAFPSARGVIHPAAGPDGTIRFDTDAVKGVAARPGAEGYQFQFPFACSRQVNFAFFSEGDGTAWAGGAGGTLLRYKPAPDESDAPPSPRPPLHVRSIASGDTVLYQGFVPRREVELELGPGTRSLRVEFALPRYDAAELNHYTSRLSGRRPEEWTDWRERAWREFSGLQPGSYHLQVVGRGMALAASDTATVHFRILPPWHRSALAYLAYALLLVALVVLAIRWRVRRLALQRRRLEREVEQRTAELARARDELEASKRRVEELLEGRTRDLIRSERQAVFGQLVQGIVHNLKGPLSASGMSAHNLRLSLERLEDAREEGITRAEELYQKLRPHLNNSLQVLESSHEALQEMVATLLAKSRSDHAEGRKVVDLNDVVRREWDFLRADMRFKHSLKKHLNLARQPLPVLAVPGEIGQVVQNLIRNALDAMWEQQDPALALSTELDDKARLALLEVTDNGPGIPVEVRDHIYDPFFTTKAREGDPEAGTSEPRGTGLGLWMAMETVRSHSGELTVVSPVAQGRGTRFQIRLPLAEASPES